MASPTKTSITVVDVYDLATKIGKDFEKLIDQYGRECVLELMPKVICALEMLEEFATRIEQENEQIASLEEKVEYLEAQQTTSKEEHTRFEQEVEQREENYQNEMTDLLNVIQTLQTENRRLNNNLGSHQAIDDIQTENDDDSNMMLAYKTSINKQRKEIRMLQRDCDSKSRELDDIQMQIEQLQRQQRELQHKNRTMESQSRALIEEKFELILQMQQKDEMLSRMQDLLGESERAQMDLIDESRDKNSMNPKEMLEALEEESRLRARVIELEAELQSLRPSTSNHQTTFYDKDDDEVLVYGPIPREPEEKLHPWRFYERKESGIRKLFRWLLHRCHQKKEPPIRMSSISKKLPQMQPMHKSQSLQELEAIGT